MNSSKKLSQAARLAEKGGSHDIAFRIHRVARSVRAAGVTEVKLETWEDFHSWWNNNRSPDLLFSMMDILGKNHPALKALEDINEQSDAIDEQLNQVYLSLRGNQDPQGLPAPEAEPAVVAPAVEPAAVEPAPAPADEEEPEGEEGEEGEEDPVEEEASDDDSDDDKDKPKSKFWDE